jgi:hypothetical protein
VRHLAIRKGLGVMQAKLVFVVLFPLQSIGSESGISISLVVSDQMTPNQFLEPRRLRA